MVQFSNCCAKYLAEAFQGEDFLLYYSPGGEHYVTREGMAVAGRLVPLYTESGNRELEHRLGYRVILKLILFPQQEISEIFTTFQTGP